MAERSVAKETLKRLREFTEDLEQNVELPEKYTCRKVILDLHPQVYGASEVKAVRSSLNLSQPLFAQFLGVRVSTVQKWESGVNRPKETASRMMDEMQQDPDYWQRRLKELRRVTSPAH